MGSRAALLQLLQRLRERAPLLPRPFHRGLTARSRLVPPVLLAGTPPCRRFGKYGSVSLVLSGEGERKPRFELVEEEPPKKEKWRTKKRLKMQRKREKRKRKEANKRDPRRVRPKGKKIKQRFPTAEDRLKYKIEKAKMKEEMLVEKLKRYEVPKLQGPMPEPDNLTGEERFYMKKMAQKRSNYVPVGRRGVFGGVILNMHLHWKKHETVKVICKPCKPGQVHEYTRDIARLSGGIPIQIIEDDTIIFYRGKNYVQPEVMSPIDTLSKKKALEKSKYEQSLETVRRFIAISEKELELYYRHVALYGDPALRYSDLLSGGKKKMKCQLEAGTSDSREKEIACSNDDISEESSEAGSDDCIPSGAELDSNDDEVQEDVDEPDDDLTGGEYGSESEELSEPEVDSEDEN